MRAPPAVPSVKSGSAPTPGPHARRRALCAAGVVAFVLMTFSSSLYAADIRGRVDGRTAYYPRPYPLAGVPVTLFVFQPPSGWRPVATSYTAPDGMYYFRGVPAGSCMLQVQGLNFPITVSPAPFQDIPPLLVSR